MITNIIQRKIDKGHIKQTNKKQLSRVLNKIRKRYQQQIDKKIIIQLVCLKFIKYCDIFLSQNSPDSSIFTLKLIQQLLYEVYQPIQTYSMILIKMRVIVFKIKYSMKQSSKKKQILYNRINHFIKQLQSNVHYEQIKKDIYSNIQVVYFSLAHYYLSLKKFKIMIYYMTKGYEVLVQQFKILEGLLVYQEKKVPIIMSRKGKILLNLYYLEIIKNKLNPTYHTKIIELQDNLHSIPFSVEDIDAKKIIDQIFQKQKKQKKQQLLSVASESKISRSLQKKSTLSLFKQQDDFIKLAQYFMKCRKSKSIDSRRSSVNSSYKTLQKSQNQQKQNQSQQKILLINAEQKKQQSISNTNPRKISFKQNLKSTQKIQKKLKLNSRVKQWSLLTKIKQKQTQFHKKNNPLIINRKELNQIKQIFQKSDNIKNCVSTKIYFNIDHNDIAPIPIILKKQSSKQSFFTQNNSKNASKNFQKNKLAIILEKTINSYKVINVQKNSTVISSTVNLIKLYERYNAYHTNLYRTIIINTFPYFYKFTPMHIKIIAPNNLKVMFIKSVEIHNINDLRRQTSLLLCKKQQVAQIPFKQQISETSDQHKVQQKILSQITQCLTQNTQNSQYKQIRPKILTIKEQKYMHSNNNIKFIINIHLYRVKTRQQLQVRIQKFNKRYYTWKLTYTKQQQIYDYKCLIQQFIQNKQNIDKKKLSIHKISKINKQYYHTIIYTYYQMRTITFITNIQENKYYFTFHKQLKDEKLYQYQQKWTSKIHNSLILFIYKKGLLIYINLKTGCIKNLILKQKQFSKQQVVEILKTTNILYQFMKNNKVKKSLLTSKNEISLEMKFINLLQLNSLRSKRRIKNLLN